MRTYSLRNLALGLTCAATLCGAAAAQEPTKTTVSGQPFVANLHLPSGNGPFAAIITVGGSGGGIGWQDWMADVLARNGFGGLALAYFRAEGLPEELDQIPMEYFGRALAYLREHPSVDADRIGIVGQSRGAELALLFASHEPAIRAVAAWIPSAVVWQSSASLSDNLPHTSSWSHNGKGLPFVPRTAADPADNNLADSYRRSLERSAVVERATIEVENINGPVLLFSGREDTVWPSSYMSEMLIARLRKHSFRFPYEHVAYKHAGHLISQVRSDATRWGGTEEGTRFAQEDSQRRVIKFFARHLRPPLAGRGVGVK
jgi:dienelactone hydrolase